MSLTVKRIAKLKPGRYADGLGLYLEVQSPNARSWLFRYEIRGRERWMGLGPLHTFGLHEARERARKARQQLIDGVDPLEAKDAERKAAALAAARSLTFEAAARSYYEAHEAGWKNAKHRAQFLSTLAAYVFPVLGKLSVAQIDTTVILKALEPIWKDRTETANRVRGRIEAVLDWAAVRGYRTGDNPARWRGHLAEVLPAPSKIKKPVHHAALPFAEINSFVAALQKKEGIAARALEFLILTAARTGEVIGAKVDEIDLHSKTWTVPAGRIKGGREHRVPLSGRALDILRSLPSESGNDYLFIGMRKGDCLSNMAMTEVMRRMDRGDLTVHGFRSTFRDWAAERTNYPNHVVEMALAHAIGSRVEAAYRRGDLFDKRRRLMDEWARYATSPATAGEVVSIRGRR